MKQTTYDPGGRVTSIGYDCDAWGNVLKIAENNVQSPAAFHRTYAESNRISGLPYDGRGNLTSDGAHTYVWDNLSRLSRVTMMEGGTKKLVAQNLYDDRGLRMRGIRPTFDTPVVNPPSITITDPHSGTTVDSPSSSGARSSLFIVRQKNRVHGR